jgi:hypothetical protein
MTTKLFLLYEREDISEYSHPDIIPLKLDQTYYFESEAFRMITDLPNVKNIGFLTPSSKHKIKDFSIEKLLNLEPNPIIFLYDGNNRYIPTETQAIKCHGESFLTIWKYILDKHFISHSIINTYYGGFSNLWIAKKDFVVDYLKFAKKTMFFLDNSPHLISELLLSDSKYPGVLIKTNILQEKFGFNYYPYHPFVMERLISLFTKTKHCKVVFYDEIIKKAQPNPIVKKYYIHHINFSGGKLHLLRNRSGF